VPAAAEIVRGAVIAVEIVVAADVRAAAEVEDVGAGAVDVRAAVVVEIAGVVGVLAAGAAAGGTKVRCDDLVSTTSLPRIYTDPYGSINVS
jgi:hypothetical protein